MENSVRTCGYSCGHYCDHNSETNKGKCRYDHFREVAFTFPCIKNLPYRSPERSKSEPTLAEVAA